MFSASGSKSAVFFVGHLSRLDIRVGIKINLVSVIGPNKLRFYVWGRNRRVFCAGVRSTSVLCAGRKLLSLNFWLEIDLFITRAELKYVIISVGIDRHSFRAGG